MRKLTKNTRLFIIAGVVLVVLGLILALLIITEPAPAEEEPDSDTLGKIDSIYLQQRSVEDVKTVEVVNEIGKYVIDSRLVDEKQVFAISTLENAVLDQGLFNSNLAYITTINAKQLVEENADLSKYGLQNPRATVKLTYTDGTSYTVKFGSENEADYSVYISLDDEKSVYTLNPYMDDAFVSPATYFVSKTLMAEYDAETSKPVDAFSISPRDGAPIVMRAKTEEESTQNNSFITHMLVEPFYLKVDASKGEEYIYGMFGLTASEAVGYAADGEYGLREPLYLIEMLFEGKTYTLQIGDKAYGDDVYKGHYGTFSETGDMVYIFDDSSLPWLDVRVEDIMAKLFMAPYIYSIDCYEIQLSDMILSVRLEGDKDEHSFYLGDKQVDTTKAKELYQFMIGASAEEVYTGEVSGQPIAGFRYVYKEAGKEDDVVDFYASDDRKIIIKVNGETMFKTRSTYITRLEQNFEAFLNDGEIVTSW